MQCQQTTTQFSPFLHPILVCDNYKRHRRDNNRDMSRQICVPSHLLHVTRNNSLRWCWWTLDHCLMFVIFAKVNRMLFIVYKSNFYFMEIKQLMRRWQWFGLYWNCLPKVRYQKMNKRNKQPSKSKKIQNLFYS